MVKKKTLLLAPLFVLALVLVWAAPAQATNTNHTGYWEAEYAVQDATCYKHEGRDSSNAHGYSDGTGVTLNTFDLSWPGDQWVVLIVKGGNGFHEYPNPETNIAYGAPINNGGNVADVSHWIVCKGTAPSEPEVTPTVTPEPEATPVPTPTEEPEDAFVVVGICAGDQWVEITTRNGETTETREYDPTCVDPYTTPACGPLGSCGTVPLYAEPEEAPKATPVTANVTFTG